MFRSLFIVAAIAGVIGAASTTGVVSPITSPGWIAEPPYDDCPPGTYRARSGDCVERPDSNPGGSTGKCCDGSDTHAEHRRGACSSHGGVCQWFAASLLPAQANQITSGPIFRLS